MVLLQDIQQTGDFFIKPEAKAAALDTSQWPLLLKVGPESTIIFLCV